MKSKILFVIGFTILSSSSYSQIQTSPEKLLNVNFPWQQASITTSNNKPFWLGTGEVPSIHLDSNQHHKVGIGVGFKSHTNPLSAYIFEEHAKLHIRHEGGVANLNTSNKGPQLLLDEATADKSAILRFRQSTIVSDETGNYSMLPGARYWDIRGFANSTNPVIPWGDELLFINSGLPDPIMTLAGNGALGINKQAPERSLHVNGDALIQNELGTKSTVLVRGTSTAALQLGQTNLTTGYGEISYDNASDAITINTNQNDFGLKIIDNKVAIGGSSAFNPSSALDVHGFSSLGEFAPKIKMQELSLTMPAANGVTTVYNILPVDASKILNIKIIVEDNEVSPSDFYTADGFVPGARFTYKMTGTSLIITTLGQDVALSAFIGGDTAKVFITFKE